ncbi:MAG: RRXRR domain-containing protein [Rivularia sp. (in: cyanobacteria)]
MHVPVVDKENRPLMPTTPSRAKKWIKSGKATPFFRKGVFCLRLNVEPSDRKTQPIAVGIDPGSEREGYTVKSKAHTYLNIQSHTVNWVKKNEETSSNMRRGRRFRKTPCRQPRWNRNQGRTRFAPSTKARWQLKLRVAAWLNSIFPLSVFVVEDVQASTRKQTKKNKARKWNSRFSPLQVGKSWCYYELQRIAPVILKQGYETAFMRKELGLKKGKNKKKLEFKAHCVDSWVLANSFVGGHSEPDNTNTIELVPLQVYRRQLHRFQPRKGGDRPRYGGTMSVGLKRGGIVKHSVGGFCYVGGWLENPTKKDPQRKQVSLHDLNSGKRLTQNANIGDIKFLSYNSWRIS